MSIQQCVIGEDHMNIKLPDAKGVCSALALNQYWGALQCLFLSAAEALQCQIELIG